MVLDPSQTLRRVLIAAALSFTAAAQAASPTVDITIVPVPSTVSYSRPSLTTRAAYEVTVVNRSTNTINDVRLLGTTSVVGATATAPFAEAIGASCTGATTTSINCSLGQLRGGGGASATSSFVVIFNAPAAGASIQFNWTVAYGEGLGDSTDASHVDTQNGQAVTALGTPTATDVRSYVPSAGATLFTGLTGIATEQDKWTTIVTVPAFAKAEVLEDLDLDGGSCTPNYLICVRSTLTIPGTFNYLLIKLRRDVSTLAPKAKIENAVLSYTPGGTTAPVDIVPCGANETIPAGQKRCLLYRLVYTKKNSPTPDYVGDWEFGIKALENGRISW